MRPSMLLLLPALALVATAPDARAGDHHPVFAPHVEHAAAHAEHSAAHAARVSAALADVAESLAGAGGNPEAEQTEADDSTPDDVVVVPGGPVAIPLHLPASAADKPDERRVGFDLGGAYGALAKVDLTACKTQGLTAGYGHVVLAFEPDGTPAGVGVDVPAGSTPAASACVAQAFGAVQVARFDGPMVHVRRAFFVPG